MNLIGKKVIHNSFGEGIINDQKNDSITVSFSQEKKKFVYPDAFTNFLKAKDSDIQAFIKKEIEDIKALNEEKKRKEEAEQKIKEEQKVFKEATRKASNKQLVKKPVYTTRPKRINGKPMIFFIFQGHTFDKESRGGYIWAPITNKSGSIMHHWDRLLDVCAGDIILHGCDGYIMAISTSRGECYECQQPEELRVEDLWDRDGRRVDCYYILIQRPIKTSNYKDDIIMLSTAKYSPFDKDGNGNMGYLYEINRDLARVFVRELANANKYLLGYEVVDDFLNEETY